MDNTAYFAAVPFERDEDGAIKAGQAREVPSEIAARCLAAAMSATKAGAVAVSCESPSSSSGLGDAVILASYGDLSEEIASEREHLALQVSAKTSHESAIAATTRR